MRIERARDAGEHRGGDERAHAVAEQVDAHHARRRLILPDRLHRAPDAAFRDEEEDEHGEREQRVDLPGFGNGRNARESQRAAEEIDVEIERAQHFAEPDRGDGEIDAGKPHRGRADGEREDHRRHAGGRQHEPERPVQLERHQRGGIGAEPHERGLAERELPDREHHVHREREQAVDAEPVDQVLVGPEKIVEPREQRRHGHARLTAARPNRPFGRVQSTMTSTRKATVSLRPDET